MSLRSRPVEATADAPRPPLPKRILVVDDVPEICRLLTYVARRIQAVDVQVEVEVDSVRALDRVAREHFDLVVSDFRMRGPDGLEVLATARERNPRGLRILMTGYNEIPATVARIRSAGIDAYLQKPLHTQELLLLLVAFVHQERATIEAHRRAARELESLAQPGREAPA